MTSSSRLEQVDKQITEMTPLVSIVMPVYNGKLFIEKAVKSVLNQTYHHWELVIVNDGSTDNTLELLSALDDPRIRVVSQENGGTAIARNHAMSLARGDYIALLDADDLWLPTKLAYDMALIKQLSSQRASTDVIIYGWFYGVDDDYNLANFSPKFIQEGLLFEAQLLEEKTILYNSCLLFHRHIYETLGGYQPGLYHEDFEFILRISRQYPSFCTRQRLTLIRQTTDGKCRGLLKDYDAALTEQLAILDYFKESLSPEILAKATLLQLRNLFYRFLMYGYMDSAKRLVKTIQEQTPNPGALLYTGTKGRLAKLSLKTNINWLQTVRITLQSLYKTVYAPWWNSRIKAQFS